jgi:hypothetical protein
MAPVVRQKQILEAQQQQQQQGGAPHGDAAAAAVGTPVVVQPSGTQVRAGACRGRARPRGGRGTG